MLHIKVKPSITGTELLDRMKDLIGADRSRELRLTGWDWTENSGFHLVSHPWQGKASFLPTVLSDALILRYLPVEGADIPGSAYSTYHAQMLQLLAYHFAPELEHVMFRDSRE